MYIRRTHTRSTQTGESYHTYRLVRSERVDGKVRQLTLLNLGRHFETEQSDWPVLCARIEHLLGNQASLLDSDCSAKVEKQAQRIAAQLIARNPSLPPPSKPTPTPAATPASVPAALPEPEIQSVLVDTLELSRPRTVGVEAAGLWAMQQVDFTGLLTELGFTGPQRALAVGTIIGRMTAPGSELSTDAWLKERSGLGELLDVDFEAQHLNSLYRISDRLLKVRSRLEDALFGQLQTLFGFSTTITLYDLTNTYFEGQMTGADKAKRGHSKEKRTDCPLVTLGLVLDGSGFVRRSGVFAGNVSEGTTLQGMLQSLSAPQGALVIMDRGIATEANITWLRTEGYRYLVVSRERERQFDPERATTLETKSCGPLQLEKVLSEDGKEVRLYCYSEARAAKETGINNRFSQAFEKALDKLHEGLSKPRTTKKLNKLWERIGRLKAQSHGASQHYEVELLTDETGQQATGLRYQRRPAKASSATHPGVYCLRSSETDWDEHTLWRTYSLLTDLESVFRSLKSELGLRPVFHHTQERIDGHLFITVLAYQFVQVIRNSLRQRGSELHHASWQSLRNYLSGQVRVTAVFQQPNGRALHLRKATQPEGQHLVLCNVLGMDTQPGRVDKLIY